MSDSLAIPIARQAPLSRAFSRKEYWSVLPFPPPEDLTDPEIEPASPALVGRSHGGSPYRHTVGLYKCSSDPLGPGEGRILLLQLSPKL